MRDPVVVAVWLAVLLVIVGVFVVPYAIGQQRVVKPTGTIVTDGGEWVEIDQPGKRIAKVRARAITLIVANDRDLDTRAPTCVVYLGATRQRFDVPSYEAAKVLQQAIVDAVENPPN